MISIIKRIFLIVFLLASIQSTGQTIIQMEKDGGVYKIPCQVNGLRLKLIFDTGASSVCISGTIANMMLENGYLEKDDIVGTGQSIVADGRIVDNTIINIKELKIGEIQLKNIEAVVIHQQSAPLLLGQSAIQRLGLVSIKEDKLIINQNNNSPIVANKTYTDEEIDNLFDQAANAMENEAYELASEYYSILYKLDVLTIYGKSLYADCLRVTDKCLEAIPIYKEVISDINSLDHDRQIWIYYGMQLCCIDAKDYNSAIQYGQLALQKTTFAFKNREGIIFSIASSYKEKGDNYSAVATITNEIEKYLSYMEINATDCWSKEYKDSYLAKLYFNAYLVGESLNTKNKYLIVSAAWGYNSAIEIAKEYNIIYTEKPKNYVY